MATGTQTTMRRPFIEGLNTWTPGAELLSTAGSASTAGSVPIFSSATTSGDFFLTSLNVSLLNATNTALFSSYLGTTKIATYPTLGAAGCSEHSHAFGAPGVSGGTTTTATVSVVGNGAQTATVQFFAVGWRKK